MTEKSYENGKLHGVFTNGMKMVNYGMKFNGKMINYTVVFINNGMKMVN